MCGVSVLCLGGDTACAVSLSVVWLETFVCACFSYRYLHVIVFVLSVFFLLLSIFFCKFGSASFINNLNLTGYAGGQPGGRLSGGRRWTAVGGGRRQIMCNSVSQEPTNSSRYFYNADNKCVYTSIYIYI